jgi:hypothetical protein
MEIQQILELLLANQEKEVADRKAYEMRARMKFNQEDLLERMEAKAEAIRARTKARQEEMLARMQENTQAIREEIKSGQAEMRSIIRAFRSEMKETITWRGATETKRNPGLMQSIEEHQEIPKGEAAVMPIGGPRERCRVCNLAAECHQKMKERTWGNSGSRRKSAAVCRKVSRRAKVAWRKRNSSGELGPRKTVDRERSSPLPE